MTTEEVEIQTTETEEVHICDGCGMETDDSLEYKPFTTSGYHSLHFCDTDCVDSVRATEHGSNSPDDELCDGCDEYLKSTPWVMGVIPFVNAVLWIGTFCSDGKCDNCRRAAWVTSLLWAVVFGVVIL